MNARDDGRLMAELARTFPSLRSKFEDAHSYGLAPWNASKLAREAGTWSAGERLTVSFLLTVWDLEQTLFPSFNVVDAFRRWDEEHWEAFLGWVEQPFFC